MANQLHSLFIRLPLLLRIFTITVLFLILFGIIIHFLEPTTFPNIVDGIWWAIVTATSVGYGDFVPQTLLGRIAAVLLIMLGAGFVTSYFSTLAASTVTKQNSFLVGKSTYKDKGHYIIIGWNERTKEVISNLLNFVPPVKIVLVDDTLNANPIPFKHVHFIKGKAHLDETMLRCNIREARKVLITADPTKDELQADMNSILALLSIKGIAPEIPCIVEILTKDQVINAKRAGADEVIQTNNLISVFMLNSLDSTVSHGLIQEVFEHLRSRELQVIPSDETVIAGNFSDASNVLLLRGLLLLGLKKGENIIIHPPHHMLIENGDFLITMNASNHLIK